MKNKSADNGRGPATGSGIPYSQNRRNGCTGRWIEWRLFSGFWLRADKEGSTRRAT